MKRIGEVVVRTIESEMKRCFIDYSMSVIMSRALPDVRDGLKPVHRRILYAMSEMGLYHDKPFKKSARVVGETLGKYHPHGDQAVYDALVRMAQDFSLRYPLVDGQGNFGSVDGDAPAAMRYTEVRLSEIAELMIEDIDKDTVDWRDNFDGTLKEPEVLPSRFPNLLVNGSSGIAVGMATNIPPHNLKEVIDGIIAVIDDPKIDTEGLMRIIKGPDFPTGGVICGRSGIRQAYETGRGLIRVRGRVSIEGEDRKRIVITEIPYQVNKSDLLKQIADLVKSGRIDGITDLRDESDKSGLRVVIELRKDVVPDIILNQLFQHTQLQVTFGILNLAIVDGEPKILSLKEMIQAFIRHRVEVITRKARYLLRKAEERLHVLEGFLIALDNIDEVIDLIKRSDKVDSAKMRLMKRFSLSEVQAKAILDMRLQRLTGMERKSIEEEYEATKKEIDRLKGLLAERKNILQEIKKELIQIRERFGDERRTEIVEEEGELRIEDLIPEEDVLVVITHEGYIKRMPIDLYRIQRRGGVGLLGMETKEEDFLSLSFMASTHDDVLLFTNQGRVYRLKCYEIPEGGRRSKGKAVVNLLPKMNKGERVVTGVSLGDGGSKGYLVLATKKGFIKRTKLEHFKNIRSNGLIAIELRDDELADVVLSSGDDEIFMASKNGKACWFDEREIRPMGRNARGVVGMRLEDGDELVSLDVVKGDDILTLTENGFGKRSGIGDYRKTRRGSKGVKTILTNDRNGKVIFAKSVREDDEVMILSREGMISRIKVKGIRRQGRNTAGVRIMRLKGDDKVVCVTRLRH
ncbi:MAG TPA: DNA gyrase subunit A [Thermoplasmatales archaeon]|nr:DNA gyrase subunit A [Thermoplasmatales archaeon]HEX17175.1 DNA gyrase subunit A [Thermoplasmatales archaeon]